MTVADRHASCLELVATARFWNLEAVCSIYLFHFLLLICMPVMTEFNLWIATGSHSQPGASNRPVLWCHNESWSYGIIMNALQTGVVPWDVRLIVFSLFSLCLSLLFISTLRVNFVQGLQTTWSVWIPTHSGRALLFLRGNNFDVNKDLFQACRLQWPRWRCHILTHFPWQSSVAASSL